jgi:hypothetical protein
MRESRPGENALWNEGNQNQRYGGGEGKTEGKTESDGEGRKGSTGLPMEDEKVILNKRKDLLHSF